MRWFSLIILILLAFFVLGSEVYAQDDPEPTPSPTPPGFIGVIPDSSLNLQKDSDKINLAAMLLTFGAMADISKCIGSAGTAPGFFMPNACPEAVLFAMLAVLAQMEREKVDDALDAQLGGGKLPCTAAANEQCAKLSKFMKVKKAKDGCHCDPVTSASQTVQNAGVSEYLPDDLKSLYDEALETGDTGPLVDALGDYGEFATTDVDALSGMLEEKFDAMSDAEIAEMAEALGLEPGEEGEEGEEIIDYGGGATAKGRVVLSGEAEAGLSPDRLADLQRMKAEWKKAAKRKGSGIIANERRELFVAVERQYDQMEEEEFVGSLIIKQGRYVDVKYIPDEETVKEAVEAIGKPKKKRDLSDIIEETGKE